MGVEQAIFTACEAGITSDSAGFQVYSYSSGMERILKETNASMMFQYEQPRFGRIPIFQKLEPDSYPKKFAYSIVEEEKKQVCFAFSTMVKESRYGSYFSHLLATNLQTVTKYPCEYYKSPLFLQGLTKEQQESKKRPDLLYKIASMQPGEEITYDSVRTFLLGNNRLAKFKKLLAALLNCPKDEYGEQKKLIIFDENNGTSNHVIYWIAAVTMVLPLQCARKISFSDYEYEPMTAPYQICGSIKEGTRYDKSVLMENCNVCDFEISSFPNVNIESEFYDVAELSYRVSRECVQGFHEFMKDYEYEECDLQLLDAYELYKLITVPEYITKMTRQKLHNAFVFASNYALESAKQKLISDMIHFVRDRKSMESRVIRELLAFFEVQVKEHRIIKERLILPLLRILYESLTVSTKEEKNYVSLRKEMIHFFEQIDLSLYKYYLGSLPLHEFLLLLRKTSYQWKVEEAVSILKNYLMTVKPTVMEMAEDKKMNALITMLLYRSYMKCPSGKLVELSYLMKAFSFDYSYTTYIYLTAHRFFEHIQVDELQETVADYHYARYFHSLSEKEQLAVYEYLMIEDETAIVKLFHYDYEKEEAFEPWFQKMTGFIERYRLPNGKLLDGLMIEAMENATSCKETRYQSVQLLFHYSFKIGYKDRFINRLIPYLSVSIPLVVTDEDQLALIKKLYFYQVNYNAGIIEKRVALAYRLYELKEFLESNPKKKERIKFAKIVPIPTMNGLESSNYLKRAGTIIGEIIYRNGQVNLIRTCYHLSGEKKQQFLLYVYSALLNCGKKHREYIQFLHAFVYAMDDTKEDLLATLILNSGVKVKDLNEQLHVNMQHLAAFRRMFDAEDGREEKIIRRWKMVRSKCLGKPC